MQEINMTGWGCGRTVSHMPNRKETVIAHLNRTAWILMALMPGARLNLRFDLRCDPAHCEMARPSTQFTAGLLLVYRCIVIWIHTMERCSGLKNYPLPIAQRCSPDAGLSSLRTSSGKRCRLNCCLDLGENLHLSLAGVCLLATFSLHSHAPQSSVSLATPLHPGSSPALEIMSRLRHRM